MKVGVGIGGAAVAYYVAHLEQVPETGRWRFINVGPAVEAQLGDATRQSMYEQYKGQIVPPSHPISVHVRRVVTQILSANNLGVVKGHTPVVRSPIDDLWDPDTSTDFSRSDADLGGQREWEVIVINDKKMVNAAALPGTILVFTGILPVCKDDQGLAAVLSHEIAHVVARHTAERVSSQAIAIAFMIVLAASGLDLGISHILHSLLLDLPNSRTQELEADAIGLRLMSKACYDPKFAPEMFSRLAQLEASSGMRVPKFISTHPTSESRVKYLEEMLPEAYNIVASNPDCARIQDQATAFRDLARMKSMGGLAGFVEDHW
ncbi:metalloendopeptidase [Marasmius crinis-equi]|uniref:Metalloendopeptidase n=1 Tax=Marasmius crinis-equi TaxID=585013 RepID=A0ABR3G1S5_9AGAR